MLSIVMPLTHTQAVSDDIAYIQGQGRGLQVQTQNQRALLNELEELLVCNWIHCLVRYPDISHSKPCKSILVRYSHLHKSLWNKHGVLRILRHLSQYSIKRFWLGEIEVRNTPLMFIADTYTL